MRTYLYQTAGKPQSVRGLHNYIHAYIHTGTILHGYISISSSSKPSPARGDSDASKDKESDKDSEKG